MFKLILSWIYRSACSDFDLTASNGARKAECVCADKAIFLTLSTPRHDTQLRLHSPKHGKRGGSRRGSAKSVLNVRLLVSHKTRLTDILCHLVPHLKQFKNENTGHSFRS